MCTGELLGEHSHAKIDVFHSLVDRTDHVCENKHILKGQIERERERGTVAVGDVALELREVRAAGSVRQRTVACQKYHDTFHFQEKIFRNGLCTDAPEPVLYRFPSRFVVSDVVRDDSAQVHRHCGEQRFQRIAIGSRQRITTSLSIHTHTVSHTLTHYTYTLSHSLSHTLTHYTYTLTLSHSHSVTLTHTLSHTYTGTLARSFTY